MLSDSKLPSLKDKLEAKELELRAKAKATAETKVAQPKVEINNQKKK